MQKEKEGFWKKKELQEAEGKQKMRLLNYGKSSILFSKQKKFFFVENGR